MSSSTPTPASVINDLCAIAKEGNADLSEIKKVVEKHEAERNQRFVKSLQGVADLAVLSTATKGRRFVVAYWHVDEARTAQGIEYPTQYDKNGDPKGSSVIVDDNGHPFYARYSAMATFRKLLDESKLPHAIAYFD